MERRTRIWMGLGTALLVGGAGANSPAIARQNPAPRIRSPAASAVQPTRPRVLVAQAEAAGEGGPGEGGGAVLGTITEFRLSTNDTSGLCL